MKPNGTTNMILMSLIIALLGLVCWFVKDTRAAVQILSRDMTDVKIDVAVIKAELEINK